MNKKVVTLLSAAVALTALAAGPDRAAAQDKPAGSISAIASGTATVTRIDAEDRWITLKTEDGTLVDIQAGPAVKNFAQIKVGDKVVADAQDTMTIEVLPAGQAAPNVSGGTSVVSAPLGAKPMGVVVDTAVVSGKVTAIDYTTRSVTLQGPAGNSRTIQVGPAVRRLDEVKQGDVVVVTLKSATSIQVVSPGK